MNCKQCEDAYKPERDGRLLDTGSCMGCSLEDAQAEVIVLRLLVRDMFRLVDGVGDRCLWCGQGEAGPLACRCPMGDLRRRADERGIER